MPNYKNGKIYKLVNDINDNIYIGSTCVKLWKRFAKHKESMIKEECKNSKLYKCMNELGKEHFKIILVESFPCNTREELCAREHHYIETLKPYLNTKNAIPRDDKKYREDNKEKFKEYFKKYREENKEKIKEYRNSEEYKNTKKNVDKKYYEENSKILINCPCGKQITKFNKSRHEKSLIHLNHINNNTDI